ncbi:MAG: rod shape-determining protein MreC [Anaerolineae bacterium]|nr:rod shape-determining protein MreC [Anaerolineae bacterium]
MNLNDTQQRVRSVTIIVLAGLALLFLVLDSTGNLNNAFAFLQDPLASVMGWTAARVDRLSDALAGPRDLQTARQRIAELEAQVGEQERTIAELTERQQEYQTYVDLFNRASEAPQLQRITARVIGRDPNPLFQSIIIDKGTRDGVAVGMPVESSRGLVGQVFQATPAAAHVLLITDNVMSIAGRLSTSRAEGMVFGGGLGAPMTMDWIELEKRVEVGEIVLTSGSGGFFPEDLVIGRVTEIEYSEAELFQRAVLEPAVSFRLLEVVFVISGFEPVDTSRFEEPPENMPLP